MRKIKMGIGLLLLTVFLIPFNACFYKTEDPPAEYTVTYERGAEGFGGEEPQRTVKHAGDVFWVAGNTFVREGYVFSGWTYQAKEYAKGDRFVMPPCDVVFTAQWQKAPDLPIEGEVRMITEFLQSEFQIKANENGSAVVSNWFATYEEQSLCLCTQVQDGVLSTGASVGANDGIEVKISPLSSKEQSANVVQIWADATGETVATREDGSRVDGILSRAETLSFDGKTAVGYQIELRIPYSAIGLQTGEKKATVFCGLVSATNAADGKIWYHKEWGEEENRVNTYSLISQDGAFEANPYVKIVWGSGGICLPMSDSWMLDRDDGTEQATVYMKNESDGINALYLKESNAPSVYAAMSVHMDSTPIGGDKAPKFGFVLGNATTGELLFLYVQADSSDGLTVNTNSVLLGYVYGKNWQPWTNPDGWTLGESTTSAVYCAENGYLNLGVCKKGNRILLTVDGIPLGEAVTAQNFSSTDDVYIGVFSFGARLTVKNYAVSTDADVLSRYEC